jgi:hypothetical protein
MECNAKCRHGVFIVNKSMVRVVMNMAIFVNTY